MNGLIENGIFDQWSIGWMEYWMNGIEILNDWAIGWMEYWMTGLMDEWSNGWMEY